MMSKTEPRFWWHSQNLNKNEQTGRKGSMLRHGRCFWHTPKGALNIEWAIPTRHYSASVYVGGYDDRIGASFACGLFALWISWDGGRSRQSKELSLSYHDGGVWWRVWVDPDFWSRATPKWRCGSWNWRDCFFGRNKYSKRELSTTDVLIPMPEASYPATVTLFESTWKRPRWPWPIRMVRADIEMPKPVPIPGKGENSWDCDEDAIYSLTCPARSLEEAIAAVVESAMRSRRRHGGGVGWKSEEVGP